MNAGNSNRPTPNKSRVHEALRNARMFPLRLGKVTPRKQNPEPICLGIFAFLCEPSDSA